MDTDSFIIYIKTDDIYKDIAKDMTKDLTPQIMSLTGFKKQKERIIKDRISHRCNEGWIWWKNHEIIWWI